MSNRCIARAERPFCSLTPYSYRSRTRTRFAASLTIAGFLSLAHLAVAFAKEPPPPPLQNVLATVHSADGGVVSFIETGKGELTVLAMTPAGKDKKNIGVNGVSFRQLSTLNSVQQYQALTGGTPPSELVEAQARLDKELSASLAPNGNSKEQVAEQQAKVPSRAKPEAGAAKPASFYWGSWFRNTYCKFFGSWTYNFCWYLDYTGDWWMQRNASFMEAYLYPEWGIVGHKMEYYSCILFWCRWNTNTTWTVPQGYVGWMQVRGDYRGRRYTIFNGAGSTWHDTVYGY